MMFLWLWKRMLKILWTARSVKEEVLWMVAERRELMGEMTLKQLRFSSDVMRRESLENWVMTGTVDGRKGRGRRPQVICMDGWMD